MMVKLKLFFKPPLGLEVYDYAYTLRACIVDHNPSHFIQQTYKFFKYFQSNKTLLQENLELQHLIANSQNSLLENKERIQILKNKVFTRHTDMRTFLQLQDCFFFVKSIFCRIDSLYWIWGERLHQHVRFNHQCELKNFALSCNFYLLYLSFNFNQTF